MGALLLTPSSLPNLLQNPDFESNSVGTPYNTPVTSGNVSDVWVLNNSAPYFDVMLRRDGHAESGLNNLYAAYNGTTIPAHSGVQYSEVISGNVPASPGQVFQLLTYSGWDANLTVAGLVFTQRISLAFYDASNTFLGVVFREFTGAYAPYLPTNLSAKAPANTAYLQVVLDALVNNTNGTPYVWDGTSVLAAMRWDNLSLWVMPGQGLTSVTMPLDLPPLPSSASIKIGTHAAAAVSRSPFDGTRQVFQWAAEWLTATVELPPMSADLARAWVAWLALLRGQGGTFKLHDTSQLLPRGSVATVGAAPLVAGSDSAGSTKLHMTGFVPNAALVFRSGDWFTVIDTAGHARLHMAMLDLSADVSGNAIADVFPRLRDAYAASQPVYASSPYGEFALANNDNTWTVDEAMTYGISFDAVEAF